MAASDDNDNDLANLDSDDPGDQNPAKNESFHGGAPSEGSFRGNSGYSCICVVEVPVGLVSVT